MIIIFILLTVRSIVGFCFINCRAASITEKIFKVTRLIFSISIIFYMLTIGVLSITQNAYYNAYNDMLILSQQLDETDNITERIDIEVVLEDYNKYITLSKQRSNFKYDLLEWTYSNKLIKLPLIEYNGTTITE